MKPEIFTAYIYQIYDHWDGLKYIGSTTIGLQEQLKVHESAYGCYKRCTCTVPYKVAYKVLSNEDYDISILETVQVTSINELYKIEEHYIYTNDCVNIFSKDWTKTQLDQDYYINNIDKIKQYRKVYAHNKVSIQCECGCIVGRRQIRSHCRTPKHAKLISAL
jgi:hypothetical protein